MINSLKIKIIGLITITLVAVITLAAFLNYRHQTEMLYDMASQNANVLTETVKNSINDAMRSGHSEEISIIFNHIRSKELISSLRILDENGKIINRYNHRFRIIISSNYPFEKPPSDVDVNLEDGVLTGK